MKPVPGWIDLPPGRLGTMRALTGGICLPDEARWTASQGVDILVSLLHEKEVRILDLSRAEQQLAEVGIEFLRLPLIDRTVPETAEPLLDLAADLDARIAAGQSVAIHCRMGIGRSTLLAACVLGRRGWPLRKALKTIGKARGHAVPDTPEQEAWLKALFGKSFR